MSNNLMRMIIDTMHPDEASRVKQKGEALGDKIVTAIKDARRDSARSVQSEQRMLGMSDLGGCREFIRATLAGDPRKEWDVLKWSAEVGTAVGEHVETILAGQGFETQGTVILTLPRTGIKVTGHLDEIDIENGDLADNKTVDGTADVANKGPSDKNIVQISGYLVAAVQNGQLGPDAIGHLVYFDRSGRDSEPYIWSISYEMALRVLDFAEDRLLDVQHALATGTREDRSGRLMTDEPESWCKAIGCPFYDGCYAGYNPTEAITHERELAAVQNLIEARKAEKDAISRRRAAREALKGVEGVTADGVVVRWSLRGDTEFLNVDEPKTPLAPRPVAPREKEE